MHVFRRKSSGSPLSRLVRRVWQRWLGDERGAELVEFAMILPILVGLFLIIGEARQISTLRDDLRAATAQAARFVTAYGVQPIDELYLPKAPYHPTTIEVANKAEQIIRDSLANKHGNLGDALTVRVDWYKIVDPNNPDWRGANSQLLDPADPLAAFNLGQARNEHFAMRVQVDVPWRTILLGLGRSTEESRFNLHLVDTTVGAVPDQPFCEFEIAVAVDASGGGDCIMHIQWVIDASYQPRTLRIYLNGELYDTIHDPVSDTINVEIDPGGTVNVEAVLDEGTRYEESRHGSGSCPGVAP